MKKVGKTIENGEIVEVYECPICGQRQTDEGECINPYCKRA